MLHGMARGWFVGALVLGLFAACQGDGPAGPTTGMPRGGSSGAGGQAGSASGRLGTSGDSAGSTDGDAGEGGHRAAGSGGGSTDGGADGMSAGATARAGRGGAPAVGGTDGAGAPASDGGTGGGTSAAGGTGGAGAPASDGGMGGEPESDPDLCTPYTCLHGQRCRTVNGATACECEEGYSGSNCGVGHSTCTHGGCDFVDVAIARGAGCALRANGDVYCWANGGDDTSLPKSSAISVGRGVRCGIHADTGYPWCRGPSAEFDPPALWATIPTQAIAAGRYHVCAVQQGTTHCWGVANPPEDDLTAVPASSNFVKLEAHDEGTCGLRADGSIACWGGFAGPRTGSYLDFAIDNSTCRVRSDGSLDCSYCGNAEAPTGSFKATGTGYSGCCAIRTDDTLACWGSAAGAPSGTFKRVVGGEDTFCALATDGTIACWGGDASGVRLPRRGPFVTGARGNAGHCGIRPSGTLDCFAQSFTGGKMSPPWGEFTQVVVAEVGACALATDGSVTCFPERLETAPPPGTYRSLAAQGHRTGDRYCGVTSNGEIRCWGDQPALPEPPVGPYEQVSLSVNYACGLRLDGSLACWGTLPSAVPGVGEPYSRVSAGQQFLCVLTATGAVDCGDSFWNTLLGPGPFDDVCVVGGTDWNGLPTGDFIFTRAGTSVRTRTGNVTYSRFDCGSAFAAAIDASDNLSFFR
jgi:hypothetical protein